SPLYGHYEQVIDRESAYEHLQSRADRPSPERASPRRSAGTSGTRQTAAEALVKSVARSIGSSLGRQIVRGVLGSIFKGR
ncbi:MAG: helicase HerA-like domain-containing protein, partial [Gammaproteobacteria bacterium]